ncbi:glycoside hydrolase family 130 protein [Sphingomonas crusticola]|uniref:glycoside hydrolase family 130 protein n=1 Tax=Sphingomonas crusticola TaxID=1697973 RepID=UPI000E27267E|nr:glycoside hydrolase family 130 protein [Sphingomonas crusticola]
MSGTDLMTHLQVILRPDPSRTVVRPFEPGDPDGYANGHQSRVDRIAQRILALDEAHLQEELGRITDSFSNRGIDPEQVLLRRFEEVQGLTIDRAQVGHLQKLVIGGYFCEEYSFEAAALFNPSIVLSHDQSGLPDGTIRFVMALRGIGEGHVSSVTFRIGTWTPGGEVTIDDPGPGGIAPHIQRIEGEGEYQTVYMDCGGTRDVSETVLFPITPAQRQGIEDLRLVSFVEDDGRISHLGTYTAFSGLVARSEMLRVGDDFHSFEMHPLRGACAASKGMALFPRRINGRYAMLSRQDNENVWYLTSDDLLTWESGEKIIPPEYSWEFVQMGNCGSPIEIDEGWLVLTHGVGSVRNYCIGASLLDKDDPTKLIKRMELPLVHPSPKERDGYVPNVVYSCGGLVKDRILLLPYGVADSFTTFASVPIDDVLAAMV